MGASIGFLSFVIARLVRAIQLATAARWTTRTSRVVTLEREWVPYVRRTGCSAVAQGDQLAAGPFDLAAEVQFEQQHLDGGDAEAGLADDFVDFHRCGAEG